MKVRLRAVGWCIVAGMKTPSELFSGTGPIRSVQGPVPGTMTKARALQRMADTRTFPAGWPVQVADPAHGWPTDKILVVNFEGTEYVKRLCSEDGEVLSDFVTGRGKRAVLAQDVDLGLSSVTSKSQLRAKKGDDVLVYRHGDHRWWITSQDGAWSSWFTDGDDALDRFVAVTPEHLVAVKTFPEHDLVGQATDVDQGEPAKMRPAKRLAF